MADVHDAARAVLAPWATYYEITGVVLRRTRRQTSYRPVLEDWV